MTPQEHFKLYLRTDVKLITETMTCVKSVILLFFEDHKQFESFTYCNFKPRHQVAKSRLHVDSMADML